MTLVTGADAMPTDTCDPEMAEPALHSNQAPAAVLTISDLGLSPLQAALGPRGIAVVLVGPGDAIPGTYWGEPEAGLIRDRLYVRFDTPVHSALHEAAHYLCMDAARRQALNRDAGGDFDEENAVCYLQILLAGEIPGMGRRRMCADMDAWGYTFRLGSSARWFEGDAESARQWLCQRGLIKVTPSDAGGDDAGTLD